VTSQKTRLDPAFLDKQRRQLSALRKQILAVREGQVGEQASGNAEANGQAREYEDDAQKLAAFELQDNLTAADDERLSNIERALQQSGADFSQIVKINAFVTNLDEYADYAAVRSERFGEKLPASATVQVAGLLVGAQIEIDAVAFIPEG